MAKGGSWTPACCRCSKNHTSKCSDGQLGCFKCGQEGHIMKECTKNKYGGGKKVNTDNIHQLLIQKGMHLE